MVRLLLISSSTVHGSGYLDHCADALAAFYGGARRVLFVPFALKDRDGYAARFRERLRPLGYAVDSLHEAREGGARAAVLAAEAVFVGGGNTFRLLAELYALDLRSPLRARVAEGLPYAGASAGSNLACPTIRTTNDMPIVQPPSFAALGLVPFQINAHFVDADPTSTHKGETREQRLAEYHEENDLPVLGLREGAHVLVEGERATLGGTRGAKLFRRGAEPQELAPGADLSFLLAARAS